MEKAGGGSLGCAGPTWAPSLPAPSPPTHTHAGLGGRGEHTGLEEGQKDLLRPLSPPPAHSPGEAASRPPCPSPQHVPLPSPKRELKKKAIFMSKPASLCQCSKLTPPTSTQLLPPSWHNPAYLCHYFMGGNLPPLLTLLLGSSPPQDSGQAQSSRDRCVLPLSRGKSKPSCLARGRTPPTCLRQCTAYSLCVSPPPVRTPVIQEGPPK